MIEKIKKWDTQTVATILATIIVHHAKITH